MIQNRNPKVAIGGLGGSGTRIVAEILKRVGVFLGTDLNKENDNLLFTRLFKCPTWHQNASKKDIAFRFEIFQKAMLGLKLTSKELEETKLAFEENSTFITPKEYQPMQAPPKDLSDWGWKEPNSHIYLKSLATIFPDIKYIHVVRHGLDMAFSSNRQQLTNWGNSIFDLQLEDYPNKSVAQLEYWILANKKAIADGRKHLGERFYLCNYDLLCQQPKKEDLTIFSAEQLQEVTKMGFDIPDLSKLKTLKQPTKQLNNNVNTFNPINMKGKKCILILGMHRSGTSALAGSLSLLSVNFGNSNVPPSFDNPKGFYENSKIQDLNDQLLRELGVSWNYPGFLPSEWLEKSGIRKYEEQARNIIQTEFIKGNIFAIKDPRICLLFPFWEKILQKLEITICCLLITRNPLEIAASLKKRNNLPDNQSHLLFASHLLNAEYYSRNYKRNITAYDQLLEKPVTTLSSIGKALSLDLPKEKLTDKHFSQFLKKGLKHNRAVGNLSDLSFPYIQETYKLLYKSTESNEISAEDKITLDKHRAKHDKFTEVFYKGVLNAKNTFSKLLIDTGDGFNEKDSLIQSIETNKHAWDIDLFSKYDAIQQLRFLPANLPCVVNINLLDIEFLKEGTFRLESNAIYQEGQKYYFDTPFPQINILFDKKRTIEKFIIALDYLVVGESVLSEILKYEHSKI